jgi:hypothetical protein
MGIDPMNKISIIIRILFAVILFQQDCQYVLDSEQEDSDYESELEQQQGKETAAADDRELFSKEKHCVEIRHSVPTKDKEKSFSLVPIDDDYESDPWESHEGEMEELNVQFTSCPELVNEHIPTLHFVDLGSNKPAYDNYESDSDMDIKDFQDHTIEPFPLFIKEKHWVEINHPGPAEDIEQHVKEELSGQFFFCPKLVNEQISPGNSQPASILHSPVHSENIKRQVSHNEGQELISCQLSTHDYKFCDHVVLYMELCFPKALEPTKLFTLSSFWGMVSVPSHVLVLLSYLPSFLWIICSKEKN